MIYSFANSPYKNDAFQNVDLLKKVVEFKMKFYPRKWANYDKATLKHIRLVPDEYRLKEIEEDYKSMREMFISTPPVFTEIMNKIKELENEIHNYM